MLFTAIIFSRPSYFVTIFIAPSSRSLVSRETFLFFFPREITFSRLSFSRATTGRFSRSLLTKFPRALRASLRCITVTSRVLGAIEKIDERRDELVGGVSSCEKKRDKADRPPPSMMIAVTLVAHRVFRRRVPAVFLALFNNRALSGRDMLRSYHVFFRQLSSANASYPIVSTKLSRSTENREI